MDLTIAKHALASILKQAASVAADKSPQAMLKCIVLVAADGKLTARATDLMLGIDLTTPATVKVPGTIAIEARRASEIAKALPAGDVRLRLVKNQLEVTVQKSQFKLGTFPADEFPPVPTADKAERLATVEAAQLVRIINQTSFAMVTDETRAECALLFAFEPTELRSFAADGKRLATSALATECVPGQMVIPAKSVSEIRKFAGAAKDKYVTISRHATNVSNAFFATDDAVLSVKLADDTFPQVRPLFGRVAGLVKHTVTLPREAVIDAIGRVAICAEKAGDALKVSLDFTADGELRIHSESSTSDEGEDVVQCDSTHAVGFDIAPNMITDALRALTTDECKFGLDGTETGAVTISGVGNDECAGICMPMRRK